MRGRARKLPPGTRRAKRGPPCAGSPASHLPPSPVARTRSSAPGAGAYAAMAHAPAGGLGECVLPASVLLATLLTPTPLFCASAPHSVVQVNLEALRDDTRCPICLGASPWRHAGRLRPGRCTARSSGVRIRYPCAHICTPPPRAPLAGVLKDTRVVKDCLHRFCAACIEKSLRTAYVGHGWKG